MHNSTGMLTMGIAKTFPGELFQLDTKRIDNMRVIDNKVGKGYSK